MQESVDERPLEERQQMGEVEVEVEGGCCGMRCEKELLGLWVGGWVGLWRIEPEREKWVRNLGCRGRSKGGSAAPIKEKTSYLSLSLRRCSEEIKFYYYKMVFGWRL